MFFMGQKGMIGFDDPLYIKNDILVELLCKYLKITKNLDKIHWARNSQKLIN